MMDGAIIIIVTFLSMMTLLLIRILKQAMIVRYNNRVSDDEIKVVETIKHADGSKTITETYKEVISTKKN